MNTSNIKTIAVSRMVSSRVDRNALTLGTMLVLMASLMCSMVSSVRAAGFDDRLDPDTPRTLTAAMGRDAQMQYRVNPRAVGYNWNDSMGVAASYYDLGDTKFAKRITPVGGSASGIGGGMDVKLAFDLSTELTPRTRLYSRMGMVLWDLDVNYSGSTRAQNSSVEGNSRMIGMGAALAVNGARLSFEYERLDSDSKVDKRDPQRILMLVSSKF